MMQRKACPQKKRQAPSASQCSVVHQRKRKFTTKTKPLKSSNRSPSCLHKAPIFSPHRSLRVSPTFTATTKLQPLKISNKSTTCSQDHQSVTLITKRSLFIQTHTTPNPRSLKFTPGKTVLEDKEDGSPTTAFFDQNSRANARRQCELAYTILLLDGVLNVMLGNDFVTVTTIDDNQDWMLLKPLIYAAISDAYASNEPILKSSGEVEPTRELSTLPGDEDAVSLIKEIIDLRIRPTVMDDGGDVEFIQFDKDRVVWLLMKGSCSGCPSSGATLKHGIQNMIMHYVPEVKSVEEWKDEAELVSDDVFQRLEQKLATKNVQSPADIGEKH